MHLYEVLKRPLITEKANRLGELAQPQYAFEVDSRANKMQVKEAVEQIFNVTVQEVRVINVAAHRSRNPRSRIMGKKASKKSASRAGRRPLSNWPKVSGWNSSRESRHGDS